MLGGLFYVLTIIALGLTTVASWLVIGAAPIPEGMDISQKIFYFHVPSAISMYVGLGACAVASLMFLLTRREGWDAAGKAGADLATFYCIVVLVTGPIWAYQAWGAAWVWDPRLTGVAILGLILAAYQLVRNLGDESEAARRLAAALGLLAAPNGYLIHAAVRMWGGQHPTVIYERGGLDPTIRTIFLFCLATGMVVFAVLYWWRLDLELLRRRAAALQVRVALREGDAEE